MRTLLESKGYFLADVHYTVHEEESTADIQYDIAIRLAVQDQRHFRERRQHFLAQRDSFHDGKTMLSAGDQYDVAKMKQERERIDAALKEKGYFYFSPDFIVFQADSTAGNRTVDLSLQVKKDIPDRGNARLYDRQHLYLFRLFA